MSMVFINFRSDMTHVCFSLSRFSDDDVVYASCGEPFEGQFLVYS